MEPVLVKKKTKNKTKKKTKPEERLSFSTIDRNKKNRIGHLHVLLWKVFSFTNASVRLVYVT